LERNPGVGRDLQLQRAFRNKAIAALPPARPAQAPGVSEATAELSTGLGGQYETATRAHCRRRGAAGDGADVPARAGALRGLRFDPDVRRRRGARSNRTRHEGKRGVARNHGPGYPERRREGVQRRELWAGAYAQWAAWRSGHDTLLDQVDEVLAADQPHHLRAWSAQDFGPIAAAFDGLVTAICWMCRATE